jgi:macrolide-specific efflux system membrane fusion protein
MKKALIIIFSIVFVTWLLWKWKSGVKGDNPTSWQKTEVSRGDLIIGVLATGNVQPQNRVAIKAPVPGRIEQILVREGDWVKRGQILAWMSSGDRASLLDAARAKGPEELKRWEDLYKATPLIAPITGTIIARNVEPGQSVSSSDSPLVVSDRLIIKAQVDETDIAKVKIGQRVKVTLDAYPDQPTDAVVDHVAYEARTVSNVTIYDVDVLPEKVPAFMRSGMTANVQFQVEAHRGVLLLPLEAVQSEGSYVYIPVASTLTAQAKPTEGARKHEGKGGRHWDKEAWKQKRKEGGENGRQDNKNWAQGAGAWGGKGAAQGQGFEEWTQAPGAPLPLTRAVQTGLSDDAHIEISSGLNEGDTVLIKALVLPTANAVKSPFSMQTSRPKQKGAR